MTAPPPELLEGPFLHGQGPVGGPVGGQVQDSQFRPVKETEAEIGKDAAQEIDRLQRIINLGQRILVLRNAPGYQQFESSVKDLRKHAQNEMVGCTAGNEQLRILQGRCQGLGSILALMRNTEQNIESLAQQLEVAQHKAQAIIREDGKVVPEPAAGGI